MEDLTLLYTMGLVFVFALICGRLRGGIVTPPMVFLAGGLLASPDALHLIPLRIPDEVLNFLAELTLVLVLFTDAARIRLRDLERGYGLPVRLLAVGLPLSIAFGTIVGMVLFPDVNLWMVALLSAMLCPTDAALGQAVVTDRAVPVRIRQAINVESGLNDGICLPLVVFFAVAAGLYAREHEMSSWGLYVSKQLILGPVAGIAVGLAGGKLLMTARNRAWSEGEFAQLGVLALAILSYGLAEAIGGNGFIAAFVAGLSLDFASPRLARSLSTFAEREGQFLTLLIFLFFGVQFTGLAVDGFSWRVLLYALLALTVIRMVPVWLCLIGTRLRPVTIGFIAWFGPRGLASMIYVLLLATKSGSVAEFPLFPVVLWTVFLSVLFHGITAGPAARAYGRISRTLDETAAPEHRFAEEIPARLNLFVRKR